MISTSGYQNPIFILGAPRSFTSLICGMIGENPLAFGVPELNLFASETLEGLWSQMTNMRQIQLHGLLRTVAYLYAGEQTAQSVDMARRWVGRQLQRSTVEVYEELCKKVSPLRIVDKSPIYVSEITFLERIQHAFPDAYYIHLVRHPHTQGQSIMNVAQGVMAVMNHSIDFSTEPPTIDPQILWYRVQRTILSFLKSVPSNRQLFVRGESILENPESELKKVCRFVGLSSDDDAVTAMLHPENSPFASLGPIGAHLGNDINFLKAPSFKKSKPRQAQLMGPLPWRSDSLGFIKEVIQLAQEFGYS